LSGSSGGGYSGGSSGGYGGGSSGGYGGSSRGGNQRGGQQGGYGQQGGSFIPETTVYDIMQLIMFNVEPGSWSKSTLSQQFGQGGRTGGIGGGIGSTRRTTGLAGEEEDIEKLGTIMPARNNLIVTHTPSVHRKVSKLLGDLRERLGEQIALETRFLLVDEGFLEEIGVDMDFSFNLGGKIGAIAFEQDSINAAASSSLLASPIAIQTPTPFGYGSLLDDLAVSFLIKATQAHNDTKTLTAPKLTVLNGESAEVRFDTVEAYIADWDVETDTTSGDNPIVTTTADPEIDQIISGISLNIIPSISADKKYVLLSIATQNSEAPSFLDVQVASTSQGDELFLRTPNQKISNIRTKVNVPDGGTLLIGGLKVASAEDKEVGVPVLGKLPGIGRLFRNKSESKDQSILLILVKPTILLHHEQEEDAIGAMN